MQTTPLRSGELFGPYELLAPIGAGGMGEVWKARDRRLDRIIAIKFSKEQFSARFEREARAIAQLNHPNICTLHDVGPNYLVMEYVEGVPLEGPLPLDKVIETGRQICDALDAAHRRGITHRDLKPGNILVTRQGLKLLDFGLAKIQHTQDPAGDETLTAITGRGVVLGTPQYMAPEQIEGKEADARSDIFALGSVLYEMITGKRAFDGEKVSSVAAAILAKEPPRIRDMQPLTPPALERVVEVCLAKDPDERWQTAREVKRELNWISVQRQSARPHRASSRPAWIAAAVMTAALAGVTAYHLLQRPPQSGQVSFQIQPGEREFFGTPRISPDGRKIAVSANGRIGIRSLESLAIQILPGTEGAGPFWWSPDSGFLAFYGNQKLNKIDIAGGPAQPLCPATIHGFGEGDWNQTGIILFSQQKGIFRVPATGGEPVQVTEADREKGEFIHSTPRFLSDGRRFLYSITSSQNGLPGIYSSSIDSGDLKQRRRILAINADNPRTRFELSMDHLLFVRGDSLMRQPFDSGKIELRGDPSLVAQKVFSFSVSGNAILAYDAVSVVPKRQLAWFNRKGEHLSNAGPAQPYDSYALSPDEKRVAISFGDEGGRNSFNLWVLDSERATLTRLTFEPGYNKEPVWSPDGTRIVFAGGLAGSSNLWWKSSGGEGKEESLLPPRSIRFPGDWSRDGRYIAYQEIDPKTKSDLWFYDLESKKATVYLQTGFEEGQPKFSPDGRWVAYYSNESTTNEVYVRSFPMPGVKWQISNNGGVEPLWRADGQELFYMAPGRKIMSVPVKSGATFAAGKPLELFTAGGARPSPYSYFYAVSGDGQRFLINNAIENPKREPITVVLNWTAGLK